MLHTRNPDRNRNIQNRIETAQTDFKDPFGESMFFWTDYNPRFASLLELYEATGEKRYLNAAHEGARRFTQQIWMSPRIPERNITVNENGMAPHYWYLKRKGHKPMPAEKESVPAWRLSSIGLTSESSGTSAGHRAIFMAHYAPWLIRIGKLTNDDFLRAVGRSAIVGRYMNFPGYHINTARTTVYEKPDYPLRPHEELGVNSMHYNHIWPMLSMIVDYLVSETLARSDGAIDFPTQFIEGYAYMQSKFYGIQKGRFYDGNDAILWMPKGLLKIDNVEINYIAARGENALYLALINESDKEVSATVTLDDKLVPAGSYPVRVSQNNKPFEQLGTTQGTLHLTIPAKGLTAVVLEDCRITPRFQEKVMGETRDDAWKNGLVDFKEPDGRAMVLNLGKATRKAFIYLIDDATTYKEVSLVYDIGNGPVTETDKAFPWEFTVPLDASVTSMSFSISGLSENGKTHTGKTHQLSKDLNLPAPGELDLAAILQPVPLTAKFIDDDWYIWCGTLVKSHIDQKYHLFYSRWPRAHEFMASVTSSEVAHAVSDSPFGPFKFVDIALPPRGPAFWDGMSTHNPTVHFFNGKYYLYYTGNVGDGKITGPRLNMTHRNNQRIGVAVADDPNGPWKQVDKPIIDISPDQDAHDAQMVANPSVTQMPDGRFLMVYKAVARKRPQPNGGPVVHLTAIAEHPEGPFVKQNQPIFTAENVDFPAEDPFVWYQDNCYYAIVKDMKGAFTDAGRSLVLFYSLDGLDWKLARHPLVSDLSIKWENGDVQKQESLERPQLFFENGKLVALLCAARETMAHSYNVQIPLKPE